MTVTAVVGAGFGDEGKGRVVDALAEHADYVVRFQGGANAGHTLIGPLGKLVLHQLPSGVQWPRAVNVLGPGVALDLPQLLAEDRRAARARHRAAACHLEPRTAGAAVPPRARRLRGAAPGRACVRLHAQRHRPVLRRQAWQARRLHRRLRRRGAARDPDRARARDQAPVVRGAVSRAGARSGIGRARAARGVPARRALHLRHHRAAARCARGRARDPASRASSARCATWTTASIRS